MAVNCEDGWCPYCEPDKANTEDGWKVNNGGNSKLWGFYVKHKVVTFGLSYGYGSFYHLLQKIRNPCKYKNR